MLRPVPHILLWRIERCDQRVFFSDEGFRAVTVHNPRRRQFRLRRPQREHHGLENRPGPHRVCRLGVIEGSRQRHCPRRSRDGVVGAEDDGATRVSVVDRERTHNGPRLCKILDEEIAYLLLSLE